MVLKALFVDSKLDPIIGLDQRSNPELARILCDYAHERWAASRPVTPELWRCVGPHATGEMLDDLLRASESDDVQGAGGLLALNDCQDPRAAGLLASRLQKLRAKRVALAERIADGNLTWSGIANLL